jgi:hypothetical protein
MSVLVKEIMVMVPFLPLFAAMALGLRSAYIGE